MDRVVRTQWAKSFSRQDAKPAKKTLLILLLGVLCPVEYRLDQDRVVLPKRYSTGESHRLSDSLNQNSTENSKYVCLILHPATIYEAVLRGRPVGRAARGSINPMNTTTSPIRSIQAGGTRHDNDFRIRP